MQFSGNNPMRLKIQCNMMDDHEQQWVLGCCNINERSNR